MTTWVCQEPGWYTSEGDQAIVREVQGWFYYVDNWTRGPYRTLAEAKRAAEEE